MAAKPQSEPATKARERTRRVLKATGTIGLGDGFDGAVNLVGNRLIIGPSRDEAVERSILVD